MTDLDRTMSGPRCITIDAPGEATVLAARHLDISEGPVQTGYTVDAATRSAITWVLDYIAKAHNSPAAPSSPDTNADTPANQEIDTLRARVSELAATLAEAIGHFTIPATLGGAVLRTGHVPAATVERWRRIHTGNGPTGWMFPPVQGRCPACNHSSLFLGSGGYVTCSHTDCPNPEAATELLDHPEALAEAEERARRNAQAYEWLRCDVITAVAYIRQQKDRVGFLSPLRHSRTRILNALPNWIKDTGPLDPPNTPTEDQ